MGLILGAYSWGLILGAYSWGLILGAYSCGLILGGLFLGAYSGLYSSSKMCEHEAWIVCSKHGLPLNGKGVNNCLASSTSETDLGCVSPPMKIHLLILAETWTSCWRNAAKFVMDSSISHTFLLIVILINFAYKRIFSIWKATLHAWNKHKANWITSDVTKLKLCMDSSAGIMCNPGPICMTNQNGLIRFFTFMYLDILFC